MAPCGSCGWCIHTYINIYTYTRVCLEVSKLVYFTYLGDVSNLLIKGWNNPFTKYHGHPSIYIYMGMALKTVWIVPRWSGRLERGGYVKGHDPEVSKPPTRRSCFHDMTSYLYMSLWLGQRSHGKAERSHFGVNLTVSTLGTVDMSSKVDGLWTKSLKQGKKPNNHKF